MAEKGEHYHSSSEDDNSDASLFDSDDDEDDADYGRYLHHILCFSHTFEHVCNKHIRIPANFFWDTGAWFSFLTWVWVNIFLEIVSSKTSTTYIFQSGVRNKPARVSRRDIEVFNQQAWDLPLRRESWQVYSSVALSMYLKTAITSTTDQENTTSIPGSLSLTFREKRKIGVALIVSRFVRYRFFAWNLTWNSLVRQWIFL